MVVALVALHLTAIAFYAARGRGLTRAMVTGRAVMPAGVPAPKLAPVRLAIVVAALAAGLAWFVAHGLRF